MTDQLPPNSSGNDSSTTPSSSISRRFKRASRRVFEPFAQTLRTTKVWFLLGGVSVLLTWGGYRIGERYGLLIGFFSSLALNSLVMFYDDWRLSERYHGKLLEGRDPWGLLISVRKLARRAGLPTPQLLEVRNPAPMIFSSGLLPSRIRIYFSSGLLKTLDADEVLALFAHEVAQAQNGETAILTAMVAIGDLWLLLMNGLDTVFLMRFLMPRSTRSWCGGPLSMLSGFFLSILMRSVTRRSTSYLIDQKTTEILDCSPDCSAEEARKTLARALNKMDSYAKTRPPTANLAEAALYITSPVARYGWSRWISVQPDISLRLTRLVGRYPL